TVGSQSLPDSWGYFSRQQGGRTWYVAVMGPYPDQDRARAALADLPESLRRNRPLIRSVASLQPDLSGVKTP
ncbi:MAG: SPOR domain-containing protein, partial [Candidatus Competibacteraceae bacterium]|nr:SPOR domain-containing protein [Candidatus Competibacteraceae bacterium]